MTVGDDLKQHRKWVIPEGTPAKRCKSSQCNATIYFVRTGKIDPQTGIERHMPVDPDGTPHWVTCPMSNQFKKERRRRAEEEDG